MDEPDSVRFRERACHLPEEVNHSCRILRAIAVTERLKVDAVEVFHRVIDTPTVITKSIARSALAESTPRRVTSQVPRNAKVPTRCHVDSGPNAPGRPYAP
jgi:hypothetical protein